MPHSCPLPLAAPGPDRALSTCALHGHFCKLHRIRTSADRLLYVISTFSTRPGGEI